MDLTAIDLSTLPALAVNGLGLITTVVGAASLIVQGLAIITRITPASWEENALNKVGRVVAGVQIVLDRLALNLDRGKARR